MVIIGHIQILEKMHTHQTDQLNRCSVAYSSCSSLRRRYPFRDLKNRDLVSYMWITFPILLFLSELLVLNYYQFLLHLKWMNFQNIGIAAPHYTANYPNIYDMWSLPSGVCGWAFDKLQSRSRCFGEYSIGTISGRAEVQWRDELFTERNVTMKHFSLFIINCRGWRLCLQKVVQLSLHGLFWWRAITLWPVWQFWFYFNEDRKKNI